MSYLGEIDGFESLNAGTLSVGVPIVDGAVQMHRYGRPSEKARLGVNIEANPDVTAADKAGIITVSREDDKLLQVQAHFEVVKDGKYVPVSKLLLEEPLRQMTFTLSPSGLWTIKEVAITDHNRGHLTGFANILGRYSLKKQHRDEKAGQ